MKNNGMKQLHVSKWVKTGMAVTLTAGLLSACSGSNDPGEAENRVLRIGVLYGGSDNEPYFRQQYTDMFEFNNPNITFEIVGAVNYDDQRFQPQNPDEPYVQPDPFEKMKELMTGNNPVDVVVIDYNMLRRFTQENLLQPLDPLVTQDKFDLADYVPTVIDGIKAAGDNQLYALTPTFSSSALYYNKKIFADMNVEPPTDKMEWSDVFAKAQQVVSGEGADRTFGFSFSNWASDGFNGLQTYASALQLKTWDDKGEKMMVNSDQWVEALDTIKGLYTGDIIPDQEFMNLMYEKMSDSSMPNPAGSDLFVQGKVAMVISGSYYVNELKRYADNAASMSDFEMVDWDVVTVPVSPNNPTAGGNIGLSQLMAINAKAQNSKDAWEFIKFSNSKEWAKLKSRSNYELVARKEFLEPIGGLNYNVDAFTLLTPLPPSSVDMDKIYREKPGVWEAQWIGQEMFQAVIDGTKDSREALAEWETRGNAILEGQSEMNDDGVMIPRPLGDVATLEEASGEATVEAVEAEAVTAE